jgi:hypothetical protein
MSTHDYSTLLTLGLALRNNPPPASNPPAPPQPILPPAIVPAAAAAINNELEELGQILPAARQDIHDSYDVNRSRRRDHSDIYLRSGRGKHRSRSRERTSRTNVEVFTIEQDHPLSLNEVRPIEYIAYKSPVPPTKRNGTRRNNDAKMLATHNPAANDEEKKPTKKSKIHDGKPMDEK